jgi:hypothetical protein
MTHPERQDAPGEGGVLLVPALPITLSSPRQTAANATGLHPTMVPATATTTLCW